MKSIKVNNYESLNEFLFETLNGISDGSVDNEKAHTVARVSDKLIKNNLAKVLDAKRRGNTDPIAFFESEKPEDLGNETPAA